MLSRLRHLALIWIAFVAACLGDLADPSLPAPGDADLAARAVVFDIDVEAGTVRVRRPPPAPRLADNGGPSFALLGQNEIGIITSGFTRTQVAGEPTDLIAFDVQVSNLLLNADLVNPTFPAPPTTAGIFLVPFSATVKPNHARRPIASLEFDGPPWNFFNDGNCSGGASSDCFRFEPFPSLGAGQTSAPRRIGFSVARATTQLTVYLIVAADIDERPVTGAGVIAGTITGGGVPLPGVQASVAGSGITASSGATGLYLLNGVPAGPQTVQYSGQPPYCDPIPDQGTSVVIGNASVVDVAAACYGDISGTVFTSEGPLAGAIVSVGSVSATTAANGSFTLAHVPAGLVAADLSLFGDAQVCPNASPYQVTLGPGATAPLSIVLPCTPTPPFIVSTSLPAGIYGMSYSATLQGGPAGITWQLLNTMPPGLNLTATGTVSGMPADVGSYSFAVQASDAHGRSSAPRNISIPLVPAPNDAFEPNASLIGAANLGIVPNNNLALLYQPTINSPTDADFFKVRLSELTNSSCVGSQNYTFTLMLTQPAGLDLDVFLYNAAGTLLAASASHVNPTETITRPFTGTCGVQDNFDIVVEVRRFTGINITPYTLSLKFQ